MDKYLNDTHSMYYNVDHSSMYGSNFSTVFADSPPPLDENTDADDAGEFVFSNETNAIGEAVLHKIEGKLQREAARPKEKVKSNNLDREIDGGKTTNGENGVDDFADFQSGTNFDNTNMKSPAEMNGTMSDSGDYFGDLASSNDNGDTAWCAFASPSNKTTDNAKNWNTTPVGNSIWQSSEDIGNIRNSPETQTETSGMEDNKSQNLSNQHEKFEESPSEEPLQNSKELNHSNQDGMHCNNDNDNKKANIDSGIPKFENTIEHTCKVDDKDRFTDVSKNVPESVDEQTSSDSYSGTNLSNNIEHSLTMPDIVSIPEHNFSTPDNSANDNSVFEHFPPGQGNVDDVTEKTRHRNDSMEKKDDFSDSEIQDNKPDIIPSFDTNLRTKPDSSFFPHDKIDKNDDTCDFSHTSFNAFQETASTENNDDFGDFSKDNNTFGAFPQFSGNIEEATAGTDNQSTKKNDGKKTLGTIPQNSCDKFDAFQETDSIEDDTFGDFSQNTQKSSDTLGTFHQTVDTMKKTDDSIGKTMEEQGDTNGGDDFGDFSQPSDGTSKAFGVFPPSTITSSGKTGAMNEVNNFGDFSQSSSTTVQNSNEDDFGDFSECNTKDLNNFDAFSSTNTKTQFTDSTHARDKFPQKNFSNFNSPEFGVFPKSKLASDVVKPTKQTSQRNNTTKYALNSLQACFPNKLHTLQSCHIDNLRNKYLNEDGRPHGQNLWEPLYSNSNEGVLRFIWDKCKTLDAIYNSLNVSKDKVMTQSNIIAMTGGLEVPVFATGLGILQPSIVAQPSVPVKKKSKHKQPKDVLKKNLPDQKLSQMPEKSTIQTSNLSDTKAESIKDNSSDTASLSDTSSLDLDFFASAPSTLKHSNTGSSGNLYNMDMSFTGDGSFQSTNPTSTTNTVLFNLSQPKNFSNDPMMMLRNLDTSKISSTMISDTDAVLSSRGQEAVEQFEDLAFMHSSVLMFPLK